MPRTFSQEETRRRSGRNRKKIKKKLIPEALVFIHEALENKHEAAVKIHERLVKPFIQEGIL